MNRYICVHGHFYQPPRENPWLEEVEREDDAAPDHDWNIKITEECYAPNAASKIMEHGKKIIKTVNNYAQISFNFGPTLLCWLYYNNQSVYQAILEADEESKRNFSGHGAALAQCYNHLIMPLANNRDKRTQIIWGIKDFEVRFQRKPEGMWLPETAVDLETLDLMAEMGIKFTILAPRQAGKVRKLSENKWRDFGEEKIDIKQPYLCQLPSGRNINIFFYNGALAQEVAFGDTLKDGANFAKKLTSIFSKEKEEPELSHIANDGETYGHHHRFANMALAYCYYYIEQKKLAQPIIYGLYLEKYPPQWEVKIKENTSWSCEHGIERWRDDCGCNSGKHHQEGWRQAWRKPLRQALDWLRDKMIAIYEQESASLIKDPWAARDDYIEIILERDEATVQDFLKKHSKGQLNKEKQSKALKLLEMQRFAQLMYTSCGWFFDDLTNIASIQILSYAARAIQLAQEITGVGLEEKFINKLEKAESNLPELKNGAEIYTQIISPKIVDLKRVAIHYAIYSLFKDRFEIGNKVYCYTIKPIVYELYENKDQKLIVGNLDINSDITWEKKSISFAVLYVGEHNVLAGCREEKGDGTFFEMQKSIQENFHKKDINNVVRLIDLYFGHHDYSLKHLFKDEQKEVLEKLLGSAIKASEAELFQKDLSLEDLELKKIITKRSQ
ncbi:MAG: DUF3536 domain-containing protein [Candidatus Margulisbacteria bacterium]|nr:DUF3536 domain-containing protein [Candidatus Margulisiibacteriota bacterium]